jgi:DNA-binding transcriptional LysR family regulator
MNIATIDYNLYKPFIAVYEQKNIARAAEGLFITASAVGMRIKELERQLGVRLFVAHARGTTPTKAADELYARVNAAVAVINDAQTAIQDVTTDTIGTLRIGCPSNLATSLFLDFFCDFIKSYPNVKLDIVNFHRDVLCEMLSRRDLDVLINKMPIPNDGTFDVRTLCPLPRSFFASSKFLAEYNLKTVISPAELENVPVIMPAASREDTQKMLGALEHPLNKIVEVKASNELLYSMVKKGLGIGYVNDCFVRAEDGICRVTISGVKLPEYSVGAAIRRDNINKLVTVFLSDLIKAY